MKFMSAKSKYNIFIDSNIFIYLLDKHDEDRRNQAKKLLLTLSHSRQIVISTQVLNEVYAVATNKLKIDPLAGKQFINKLSEFTTVIITNQIIQKAVDCSILNKINYWDALMITAAEAALCSVLYTEDLNHQQAINGVKIINPFKL